MLEFFTIFEFRTPLQKKSNHALAIFHIFRSSLVNNSDIFFWLFAIKDHCKEVFFVKNTQLSFESIIFMDSWDFRDHIWWYPCCSVVSEATCKARLRRG